MTTTKEDVKKWLKAIGKDRFWLAEQCGATKRTVDDWLSTGREIPAKAILAIQRLMNGEADSSPRIVLDFTDDEWFIICEAMKAHKETFLEFINTALQNAAKEKEAAEYPSSYPEAVEKIHPEADNSPQSTYGVSVVGNIAAGSLQPGDTIPYSIQTSRPLGKNEYVLRVEGKSMEPVIMDGALVIMRKHTVPPVPKAGTIVEYYDERGVTLKKLARKKNPETGKMDYVLHPLNPAFGDIEPMDGGRVSAVFVDVLTDYRRE